MEAILIVAAISIIFIILFNSNVGKDPSRKTDAMLLKEYELHKKRQQIALASDNIVQHKKYLEESALIRNELIRRGLLDVSGSLDNARVNSAENTGHPAQLRAARLRLEVINAYDSGWDKARKKGMDDRGCNEIALTSSLYSQASKVAPISDPVTRLLMLEHMPFNPLPREEAKHAIVEYVVWREHPELANIDIVRKAISEFKAKDYDAVFAGSEDANDLPWSKLL